MSYAKARRHDRAARCEAERMAGADGIFMTREKRNRLIFAAAGIMIFAFVKGFILGYCFSRGREEEA